MATKRTTVPAPTTTSTTSTALAEITGDARSPFVMVPIELIHPHPANPRRHLGDLSELADSIRAHGIRQNLLLVPRPDRPGEYYVVIGHRRCGGAVEAGLTHVPAAIDPTLTPTQQLELMLVENLQRTDLTAVEEADGYQGLLDLGLDEKAIATATGRSRTTVAARLRLGALPEPVRAVVHEHKVTLEQAAAIGDLPPQTQTKVLAAVGTQNFNAALAKAQDEASVERRAAMAIELLDAAGATQLTKNEYGTPDGFAPFTTVSVKWATDDALADSIDKLRTIGPGFAWRWMYDAITVYRPHTLQEATETAERDARRAVSDAEYEAALVRRTHEEALARQFAELTATTRSEFLREALTRKLTAKQAAIADFAATYLVADPWHAHRVSSSNLAVLTSAVKPDGFGELETWQRADAWQIPVITAGAGMPTSNRLLAALAAAIEPIGTTAWFAASRPARSRAVYLTVQWYALLEDLGYVVSDAERAALTPAPDDEVAAADEDADGEDDYYDADEDE